jgi:hypothetical protein
MTDWRVIPGFSAYEISDAGLVRRIIKSRTRFIGHMPRGHVRQGYRTRKLVGDDGQKHVVQEHRLVLLAFVGNPPTEHHEAAHFDGIRDNNQLTNLRWATHKENMDDRSRHGSLNGERNGRAKLTSQNVRIARFLYTGKHGQKAKLARRFGVGWSTMNDALSGEHWTHG